MSNMGLDTRHGLRRLHANIRKQYYYVGETENALHIRLNGHRSDIRTKKTDKPVAEHFNLVGHSIKDLTIMVIEKIRRDRI